MHPLLTVLLTLAALAVAWSINKKLNEIMSAISSYAERVNTAFDTIGEGVDAIVKSVGGIAGDITELKRLIKELQDNPGPISPEDQALLDALETKVGALVGRVDAVKASVAELDAQTETPPTPPA
jgi:methyl-accepting chemotaxis protein